MVALSMGMFDLYVPDPALPCRWCGAALVELQGKDGPCGLLVWRECTPGPVGQRGDSRWHIADHLLRGLRLPDLFALGGDCSTCGNFTGFSGIADSGTWVDCVLGQVESLDGAVGARDLGSGMRQCSRCASHWSWPPERRWAECPDCHVLTRLEDG